MKILVERRVQWTWGENEVFTREGAEPHPVLSKYTAYPRAGQFFSQPNMLSFSQRLEKRNEKKSKICLTFCKVYFTFGLENIPSFYTMEKTYLFPSFCKKAGLGMFVPFAVAGVCMLGGWWNLEWSLPVFALAADPLGASRGSFVTVRADVFPTLVIFGLVVSLLMICFSREKDEDEYVAQLRCRTLVVSVMASYVCLLVGNLFIYGLPFLTFLFVNLFTVLVVYALLFHYRLYRSRRSAGYEE